MVHWIQAKQAFIAKPRSVRFYELNQPRFVFDKGWVSLERVWRSRPADAAAAARRADYSDNYGDDYWYIAEPRQLRDLLQRGDLTHHNGRPLVAGNERKGLLAFAVGPAVAPKRLAILGNAFDLERQVLLAADDTQPEWWLLEAYVVDPFHGSTDAKAWQAKWKAQAEAGEKPSWN